MYEAFFGFSRRPFVPAASTEHYYAAGAVEGARQNLARTIERGEGIGMVVGPSGTGKTLLCQVLAAQFRPHREVGVLASGRLSSRRALLQAILFELGMPYRDMDEGELRLALIDHLTSSPAGKGMLLLVDEAHLLPIRLLEEVRMLTNLSAGGQLTVRLVLAGNSELEERFASPRLESFSQRIVARCYLEAFNRGETEQYIHHQLAAAGAGFESVFSPDACHAVYQATGGIPRLINQVCDHALMLSCVAQRTEVSAACVQESWADLQQLPTPWNADSRQTPPPPANLIEFGGLDDEPAETSGPTDSRPLDSDEKPLERLDRIQQNLAAIDRDFEPAPLRPEVELVFDDPTNPFSERFAQEEILADRHAPEPRPLSASRDQPSPESLAATLQAILAQPPIVQEIVDAALPVCTVADSVAYVDLPLIQAQCPVVLDFPDAAPHPAAETPLSNAPEIVVEEEPEEGLDDAGPQTVRLRRARPVRPRRGDGDMIIVEEGTDEVPPAVGPIAPVRRQEYRQLFARLRQG